MVEQLGISIPADMMCDWEVLLLLTAEEEKRTDRTGDGEVSTMRHFVRNARLKLAFENWMDQMKNLYDKKIDDSDASTKCEEVALYWRLKGNQKYSEGEFDLSFKYYSKCVIFSTKNSSMYNSALANRSAALYGLQLYPECLKDIYRAISGDYPKEQQYKLLLRRVDCYIEIGEVEAALDELRECVHYFKTYTMNQEALEEEFYIKVTQRYERIRDPENLTKKKPMYAIDDIEHKNRRFIHTSAAIDLKRHETLGRQVVTKQEVKRGDVLMLEPPYAWVMLQDGENMVCDHCGDVDTSVVSCDNCSRAIYCDETCANLGNVMYHRWECAGSRANIFKSIGIAHLALRVLLLSANRGFPAYPTHHPVSVDRIFKYYSDVDPVYIYGKKVQPFMRMFNLVSNLEKLSCSDYTEYAMTACMLAIYLEKFTDFYKYLATRFNVKLSLEELKIFAGALMFRAIGQLICNGSAIVDPGGTLFKDLTGEVILGSAIYPSAAMMNHSCEPNVINVFYKNMLVVKGARELPVNTPVYNCYGPHCARDLRSGRREQLRLQYHFFCECAACNDDSRKDSVALFSAYACHNCKGPVTWKGGKFRCHNCTAEFSEELSRNMLFNAEDFEAMAQSSTSCQHKRLNYTEGSYRLKQQALYRHHTSLRKIAGQLADLYAEAGDYNRAMDLIKQNIQSLEFQYGSFSCEVTLEIRKLAHMLISRVPEQVTVVETYLEYCNEAYQITKKALYLMDLNFGVWQRIYEETKSKMTGLLNIMKKDKIIDVDALTKELQEAVI